MIIQVEKEIPLTHIEEQNKSIIIPLLLNNEGIKNSSFLQKIYEKWNNILIHYERFIFNNVGLPIAGKLAAPGSGLIEVQPNIYVSNLISLCSDNEDIRKLRYDWLMVAMINLRQSISKYIGIEKSEIFIPKYDGKEYGNFDYILELIKDVWLRHKINTVIYEKL